MPLPPPDCSTLHLYILFSFFLLFCVRFWGKGSLDLMAKMGYGTFANAATTTSITGDEGIDGIIMEDKLGFDLIYIQAKHWDPDHMVGRPEIQAFVGAIAGKGGKGLFVTTSKFTRHAIDYAKNQHIILESVLKPPYCRIIHPKRVNIRKKTAKFCLYFKPFRHSRHPFFGRKKQ